MAMCIFLELVEIENEITNLGKVNYKFSNAILEDLPNLEKSLELLPKNWGMRLAHKRATFSASIFFFK
ncbi:MAG: hypothetical protein F6K39_24835 [Okeania sp. SIO3B3]|nr:hypothetical protein [Okeania sp. SIO3B3]